MVLPFPSLVRRLAPLAVAGVVAVVGLSACGGDGDTSTATTASTGSSLSTTTPPTTAATSTSTTGSERTTVVVGYAGGTIDSPSEVEVKVGDEVVIRATSDVPEEIHVHTYDQRLDLAPGVPAETDVQGRHPRRARGRAGEGPQAAVPPACPVSNRRVQ